MEMNSLLGNHIMTEKIKTSYLQISNQLIQNYLVQKSFSKRDIESSWICSFLVTKVYALDLNNSHPPVIGSGKDTHMIN